MHHCKSITESIYGEKPAKTGFGQNLQTDGWKTMNHSCDECLF